MKKSEIYKQAITSIMHDDDMPDDAKVDVLAVLFSNLSTAEYMERKEQENAICEFWAKKWQSCNQISTAD